MAPHRSLASTPDERREALQRATAFALRAFERAQEGPVMPEVDPDALRAALDEPLPRAGEPLEATLEAFAQRVVPACRDNGHPRMFGYVSSSGTFVGAVADLLASTINQNVTSWRSAPGATEVERVAVDWIKSIVGHPAQGGGILTSGGSMANFAALATALRTRAGVDVARHGVRALPREPVFYASTMVHVSIPKAAAMLGLGSDAVRLVPVRDDFTLDLDALEATIDEDERAGRLPVAVVANAGDVNTGAVDPLGALADLCARRGLWLHADAAYGGFARLAPTGRPLLEDLGRADSVALDPHKWLFVPLDVGCLLVRDAAALRAAFSHDAEYIQVLDERERTTHAFWDYGPELSRRFRGLKVWMTLRHLGADAVAAAIEENLRLARELARRVEEAEDLELLAPVPLSIVCFRLVPERLREALRDPARAEAAQREVDALNRDVVARLQRGGDSYLSNATLHGRFALRACLVNYRTTDEDLDRLLEDVRAAAAGPRTS